MHNSNLIVEAQGINSLHFRVCSECLHSFAAINSDNIEPRGLYNVYTTRTYRMGLPGFHKNAYARAEVVIGTINTFAVAHS